MIGPFARPKPLRRRWRWRQVSIAFCHLGNTLGEDVVSLLGNFLARRAADRPDRGDALDSYLGLACEHGRSGFREEILDSFRDLQV